MKSEVQIATWNVNSIRARQERVLAWLAAQHPTVLCLQETKVPDAAFPRADFEAAGYHVTANGQRSYNGVALLSRTPPVDVVHQFGDGEEESAARFLSASIEGMRVVCVYVPNGRVVGSDQFIYKLAWLSRLRRYLDRHCDPAQPLACAVTSMWRPSRGTSMIRPLGSRLCSSTHGHGPPCTSFTHGGWWTLSASITAKGACSAGGTTVSCPFPAITACGSTISWSRRPSQPAARTHGSTARRARDEGLRPRASDRHLCTVNQLDNIGSFCVLSLLGSGR